VRCAIGAALACASAIACGGDSGPAGPAAAGSFTATIDGDAWASDAQYLAGGVTVVGPGVYTMAGSRATSPSSALTVTLTLYNIDRPGTYPIGVSPSVVGALAIVAEPTNGWASPLSGAAGTITITTLTESRMAGTFTFTATPVSGGATGSRVVTDGKFDLPIRTANGIPPLPPSAGSRMNAAMGGVAWNAATVATAKTSNAFIVTASNTDYTMSFSLASVTGAGTYPISITTPIRTIQVGGPAGATGDHCCWGGGVVIGHDGTISTPDEGTVTITSFTDTRVVGTFTATLAPTAGTQASTPLVITNGAFDVGIPQF
jgi:hypothetical protein